MTTKRIMAERQGVGINLSNMYYMDGKVKIIPNDQWNRKCQVKNALLLSSNLSVLVTLHAKSQVAMYQPATIFLVAPSIFSVLCLLHYFFNIFEGNYVNFKSCFVSFSFYTNENERA